MKRFSQTTISFFLIAISITFIQCENTVESDEITPFFQVVHYDALPAAIQAEVNATENALKTTYAYKKDKPFGKLVAKRIHQRLKSNGNTSYTLGLNRTGEGFYYDNLVVNEDAEGNIKSHIIRYQPEPDWFYQHKTEGLGYDAYSGDITIFNNAGDQLSSVTLISGNPQTKPAETIASKANETNCEIIDIQEAGLLQEGVFYVYAITITVDCSGTGGGGYEEEGMNNGFDNEIPEESGGGGSPGGGGNGSGTGEPIDTVPMDSSEDEEKVCVGSFVFTDVGSNWQNAGMSNVNVQFLTIGSIIALQNVYFPELHFGFPKLRSNGEYITNNNARYLAQEIMTQAEQATDAYQSNNPTATALQLKNYLLNKMQELASSYGGTVGTTSPMGWTEQLQAHETYFISQSWECE